MSQNKGSEGQGTTKGKTPEQHKAAKDAAKKRTNRKRKDLNSGNLFESKRADNIARSNASKKKISIKEDFRLNTTAMQIAAEKHPSVANLSDGTPAKRFALKVIEAYTSLPWDKNARMFDLAVRSAEKSLTANDLNRHGALTKGKYAAREAIHESWDLIQPELDAVDDELEAQLASA